MASEERKNILIVTLSNIGDVVLTTPVISSLRSAFPRARITVVVGPKAQDLLRGSQQIERLLVYDKEAGWSHKLELVRALREEFYHWVVDLRNSAFPFLVRAQRRSPILRSLSSKSARDRHLEILQMMKLAGSPSIRFDFFSRQDEMTLLEKLKGTELESSAASVVVAPGAGSENKRWPIGGFCQVIAELLETSPLPVAAVGDKKEAVLCARLAQVNPGRVVNLAGKITLRELAALVQQAKLVLTNDSAVMHLGYELCRPLVALFGPTDPERYGRKNEIWRVLHEVPPSSFENLSPEKVVHACQELLNGVPAIAD